MLARSWDRYYVSVCPALCPYVTPVLYDETKEDTADILIPHERIITLPVPTEVGGRCPLLPKICA